MGRDGFGELSGFHETSRKERALTFKKKILHQARERYGDIQANDPRVELLVRIEKRLHGTSPFLPDGESYLLASSDINAFALREQSDVFMHDGLMRQFVAWCGQNGETPSEDAIASVSGHELGHIWQGTQEIDPSEEGEKRTETEAQQAHQRRLNDEYDADRFALQAMARAGYNPREGLKMFRFLLSLHDGAGVATTHPREADRLRELVALVESPDTIIQNTDKTPTPLSRELLEELSQEDPRRPGTSLYREQARDRLGEFVAKAETLPDVLEVVQVAQMHRGLGEIDRLRQTEAVRTAYAKHAVVENMLQLVDALRRTYMKGGMRPQSTFFSTRNEVTNTVRYLAREYGYMRPAAPQKGSSLAFDRDIAEGLKADFDFSLGHLRRHIDEEIESVSKTFGSLPADYPDRARYGEYLQKLEYIRDHASGILDAVDQTALSDMVENVRFLDQEASWSDTEAAQQWIEATSAEDMLAWSTRDGTALFSRLTGPASAKDGGVIGQDSRYQGYLPEDLLAQEDYFTQAGRSSFIEQSVFIHTQRSFQNEYRRSRSDGHQDFLERTDSLVPAQLKVELAAKLESRYAIFDGAHVLSKVMADVLVADPRSRIVKLRDLVNDFSEEDARKWLTDMKPLSVGYLSSANSLFLAETGLKDPVQNASVFQVYEELYHLERYCTEIVRERLQRRKAVEDPTGATSGSLEEALALLTMGRGHAPTPTKERTPEAAAILKTLVEAIEVGDDHVRHEALEQVIRELKKQDWSTASVEELEEQLSPILRVLQAPERQSLLHAVLGAGYGRGDMANIGSFVEYTTEVCSEYARLLIDNRWEQFVIATTADRRLRLLQKVYDQPANELHARLGFGGFSAKIGAEYVRLSSEDEQTFVDTIVELAKKGFVHGEEGGPLYGDAEIQSRLEDLPDAAVLQLAAACKEASVNGKARTVKDSFYDYVTRRVLQMYGVSGFDPKRPDACQFDKKRDFKEVFQGIGEHVILRYSDRILEACLKAYQKAPMDIIQEGLERFCEPIPAHALRTGRSLEGYAPDRRSVDQYADAYDPAKKDFFEKRDYEPSMKREAVHAFVEQSGFLHDRAKSAGERIGMIKKLVPENTNYRDVLFAEIEADLLDEHGIGVQGHRLMLDAETPDATAAALSMYAFYLAVLPEMTDQSRMQIWGRRANALYNEHIGNEPVALAEELGRIERLFPVASFARDEALYGVGNTALVKTPEDARRIQNLLTEMQRQTKDSGDLRGQSQLEQFNQLMGNLSRTEKKDFILWTIGADDKPPKTLRAYGGLNAVSFETVPQIVFAAAQQEREQLLLRMFIGSNGLFEPQNPEDEKIFQEFVDRAFAQIFPDDADAGITGQPREVLRTVFSTVLTEYDSYRGGKIFIGMLEAMKNQAGTGGRGEKIATLMGELGPVFIKIGQVLSETESAPGAYLLPEDVRASFKKLKQSAKPFHRLAAVLSLEASGEFNADDPDGIESVGETLASASIKQVNDATRSDGKKVVEKVLRPSIEKHLEEDVRVLRVIVERVRSIAAVPKGLEEVGATYVREESDFTREVANTRKINQALEQYGKRAVIRKMPVRTTKVYSHSKTHIQEEKARGVSLEELTRIAEDPDSLENIAKKHNLTEAEKQRYRTLSADVAGARLQMFDALAFQYFQADAFHSDPHAGNIVVTPEGTLVVIDNGSIGETKQADRNNLKKFFTGFALRQPDELRAAVRAFAAGLEETYLDEVVEIAKSKSSDADKLNQILAIVTERSEKLDPAFDKFLKSFATGAYLMAGLKPHDMRMVLGAYTQGETGSLRSHVATALARRVQDNPNSLFSKVVRRLIG